MKIFLTLPFLGENKLEDNVFINKQNKEKDLKKDTNNSEKEKSKDIFFNLTKKIAAKKI